MGGKKRTFHSKNSRMRCRFPGVPENWKVACTTYGCRPAVLSTPSRVLRSASRVYSPICKLFSKTGPQVTSQKLRKM